MHIQVLACAVVLGACGHAGDPSPPPGTGDARVDHWREDLHTLARELPARHRNAFFQLPEAEWRKAIADLDQRIPALDDAHIRAGLVRLVAALGDAHTTIHVPREHVYPLVFDWFSDGIFVTGAAADHRWALGRKLSGIGPHPVADVIAQLRPLVSHENEQNIHAWLPALLTDPVTLAGADLAAADHAEFQLAAGDGTVRALDLRPGEHVPRTPPAHRPLSLQGPAVDYNYWNKYAEAERLIYFAYDECAEDPRAGPFAQFAAGTLAFADQHPVDRFVIDLRRNGGGNSRVLAPLIDGLAERPALAGRVYALIGAYTFSSASLNAIELKARLRATLVGESTGTNPTGYGEVKKLTLPHSQLVVQYSTKRFSSPGFPDNTVEPDLPVHVTAADWFAGRDPVIDAVLAGPLPPR
ncbi:MAG TPA: hypothetical protein VFT22_37320 [Kofleriaceae bacterium]|nr:hypothetical protein [Kofleriaceae bacterium]